MPISVRGGDNVSRQINDLLPPGSPVHRLVLVEVYTPSGNWSSYPPHKHDVHIVGPDGTLIESDLEEVYFYKSTGRTGMPISASTRTSTRRCSRPGIQSMLWCGQRMTRPC